MTRPPVTHHLYVDGVLVDQANNNLMTLDSNTLGVMFGADMTTSGSPDKWYFAGALDEIRLYSRALTIEDVQALCDVASICDVAAIEVTPVGPLTLSSVGETTSLTAAAKDSGGSVVEGSRSHGPRTIPLRPRWTPMAR